MAKKSEVLTTFIHFKKWVENRFSSHIKQLQIDGGGEFTSKLFMTFLRDHGISHQISCPYTPQQNGVVERKHRHIVAIGLCLLAQSRLPHSFWVEAFTATIFLINCLPTPKPDHISPYEKLLQRPPGYTFLKSFGCACFPHMVPYNRHKLSFKFVPCVFISYDDHYKSYCCLDPISGRVYISRNVVFDEASFPYQQPSPLLAAQPTSAAHIDIELGSSAQPISKNIQAPNSTLIVLDSPSITPSIPITPDTPPVTPTLQPPQPTPIESSHPTPPLSPTTPVEVPSTKPHHTTISPPTTPPPSPIDPSLLPNSPDTPNPPQKFKSLKTIIPFGPEPKPLYSHTTPHPLPHALSAECSDPLSLEPTCFTQASKYSHGQTAMQDEYDALMRNHTWTLVPASSHMNIVGCKWVFKIKRQADGSIDSYKARLVAKGFNQQEGFDYEETFSLVVKPATIHTI